MEGKNTNRFCPNCYHPLEEEGKFCGQCGQKFTTGKVSFFSVIHEFFDNFISLDSTIVRSVPLLLFKPGQLTVEFFKGKHKRYVSPVRLFLFTTLVYFALLTFYAGDLFSGELQQQLTEAPKQAVLRNNTHNALVEDIDSTVLALKSNINDPLVRNEIDSAFKHFQPLEMTDTLHIFDLKFVGDGNDRISVLPQDLFSLSVDEIIEKYEFETTTWWSKLLVYKSIRIAQQGGNFTQFLFNRLSWLIFIMVPLFALVLKILYFFKNRYLVEHLVFGLHFHSFLFIIGAVMLWLIPLNESLFIPVCTLSILLYLFLAMRRFYSQGFFRTLFKYLLLLFSFIFVIIFSSVILIFLSVALF